MQNNEMKLLCVIPAHSEAARIAAVLAVALNHPWVSRVVVVDDGSTDGTAEVARAVYGLGRRAEVLSRPQAGGKTSALALGLAQLAPEETHILLLDADLLGLTHGALTRLIAPVRAGRAQVSLSLRGNAPAVWRLIGVDYISGERVLPRDLIEPALSALPHLPRFGFEVFLNERILRAGLGVAVVAWPRVASPSKAAKHGLWRGIKGDIGMLRDMARTVDLRAALRQIIVLRRGALR